MAPLDSPTAPEFPARYVGVATLAGLVDIEPAVGAFRDRLEGVAEAAWPPVVLFEVTLDLPSWIAIRETLKGGKRGSALVVAREMGRDLQVVSDPDEAWDLMPDTFSRLDGDEWDMSEPYTDGVRPK